MFCRGGHLKIHVRHIAREARALQNIGPVVDRGMNIVHTEEIADEICRRLSTGETLVSICKEDRMPERTTVSTWCLKSPEFAAKFAKAREDGFDAIANECMEIANTPVEAIREKSNKDGVEITKEDALGHRKLQIETRLKLLAKWDPKRYGEKLDVNATVAGEIRIVVGGDTE